MVCLEDGYVITCQVSDLTEVNKKRHASIFLKSITLVDSMYDQVRLLFNHNEDDVDILIQNQDGKPLILNENRGKTLEETGLLNEPDVRLTITITLKAEFVEDDLVLGASASPTTCEPPLNINKTASLLISNTSPPLFGNNIPYHINPNPKTVVVKPFTSSVNYVGLVNQAMTCYLNSLLQTLYMTPEFRNALYNWEFDGINESRSIPFQLQKLFLNLQTTQKSAIETTDLTTSFGWQVSEAWHQHDIQELCRVMFDALERKFKDTEQANFINDLYEGRMLDYVKCLQCGTEKSREDTFLDIPLPVRPFGSTVAYNSIDEALKAFVQPEILDGNNQYFCEKCNKKCDAHKGLKFIKFPYLLTLHLKRFDFDYSTMHRIKLNDKVVFSETLNLNSFIYPYSNGSEPFVDGNNDVKCDDNSITDYGSGLDYNNYRGADMSSQINGQDNSCEDCDEGIDISNINTQQIDILGPYVYELFSIMIHSGSACGGHYYAYIKDFDKNQWYCFNDQSVTKITTNDVKKSYGGGPQRSYYSGTYSSSTNAYMLMYRQIDKERNVNYMTIEQFPPHLKNLLLQIRNKDEQERINKEKENNMIKINVYCYHPSYSIIQDVRIAMLFDATLTEAAAYAHQRFKLDGIIDIDDCRLVAYSKKHDCIICSFQRDDLKICDIDNRISILNSDWLLEIKDPDIQFQYYPRGTINVRVYFINMIEEEIEEPINIRIYPKENIGQIKKRLATMFHLEPRSLYVAQVTYDYINFLTQDDALLQIQPDYCTVLKLFISDRMIERIFYQFFNIICLDVMLPSSDSDSTAMPSFESGNLIFDLDNKDINSPNCGDMLPLQELSICGGDYLGDQSNSEDGSLSDSDRTLIGDAPDSPPDQHMPSPMDPAEDNYNFDVMGNPGEEINWICHDDPPESSKERDPYFRIVNVTNITPTVDANCAKCYRILVDKNISLDLFKKNLEPLLRLPSDYFKVFRHYSNLDNEFSSLNGALKSFRDGERMIIKLGRVLNKNEINFKFYYINFEQTIDPIKFLFEYIFVKTQTVGQVKKELLYLLKKQMIDIPFNKCQLREKGFKKPKKIYYDHQIIGEVNNGSNNEIYIQELKDDIKIIPDGYVSYFVRKWCPSTLKLENIQEIFLSEALLHKLGKEISKISSIPYDHIEVAFCRASFPCEMNILDIHTELDWNPRVTHLERWPLHADDGSVFFYRDNREILKKLTIDEKRELNQKENVRLGRFVTAPAKPYSPGRERALKIYLDTSPSKAEDNCID